MKTNKNKSARNTIKRTFKKAMRKVKDTIKRGRPAKYPFEAMKVNTSKLFPLENRNNVVSSAYLYATRHGWKFASEALNSTVRITRTA